MVHLDTNAASHDATKDTTEGTMAMTARCDPKMREN